MFLLYMITLPNKIIIYSAVTVIFDYRCASCSVCLAIVCAKSTLYHRLTFAVMSGIQVIPCDLRHGQLQGWGIDLYNTGSRIQN